MKPRTIKAGSGLGALHFSRKGYADNMRSFRKQRDASTGVKRAGFVRALKSRMSDLKKAKRSS